MSLSVTSTYGGLRRYSDGYSRPSALKLASYQPQEAKCRAPCLTRVVIAVYHYSWLSSALLWEVGVGIRAAGHL